MKMEKENIEYMDAPEITGDELSQVSQEQLVANLESDVRAYERALQQAHKDKENYKVQLELDEKIWAMLEADGSFKRISQPNFAFEDNPEYWELQRQKNMFKIRQERALANNRLLQFDEQIVQTEKALEDSKRKLTRFGTEEDSE